MNCFIRFDTIHFVVNSDHIHIVFGVALSQSQLSIFYSKWYIALGNNNSPESTLTVELDELLTIRKEFNGNSRKSDCKTKNSPFPISNKNNNTIVEGKGKKLSSIHDEWKHKHKDLMKTPSLSAINHFTDIHHIQNVHLF